MSFKAINLSSEMIKSLTRQKLFNPSYVQLNVIPKILRGDNVVVQSETGSGKTHCYLIPIIQMVDINIQKTQAIIITPTRELAKQIFEFATSFNVEFPNVKIKLLKSGEEIEKSMQGLTIQPHIVIGTPGRLKQVIVDQQAIDLYNVKQVVFDEADMLLKEGYFNDIDPITNLLNKPQYMVFSATLENNLRYKLEQYVGNDILVIMEDKMTSHNVKHYLVHITHKDYLECVKDFIDIKQPYLLLIFASTKQKVNEIYQFLSKENYKVGLLTGDLTSRERKNVMKRLLNDHIYILVCSDMASRGLDIPDVSDVLNVDLTNNLEFYYHRAGRTGRFDKLGNCYTFYNTDTTKKPLELISQGQQFEYLILKNKQLVVGKEIEKKHPTKRKEDPELNKEIQIARSKVRSKKVEPCYKKKQRWEEERVRKYHRRKKIREEIRRQRVERYKKEARNNE